MTEIQPEKGITYLCRINGGPGTDELIYFPRTPGPAPWLDVKRPGVWWPTDRVTIVRPVTARITDEGGHWEPCTRAEWNDAKHRRLTQNLGVPYAEEKERFEKWVPDAPPVVIPDEPDQDGIASGVTAAGTEFTDRPAWTRSNGLIGIRLPGGGGAYARRDEITTWRDAELRLVQS